MRIFELEQPKSAEQFKLDQLQAVNKRASLAVKNEREKQKLQHANKALQQLGKLVSFPIDGSRYCSKNASACSMVNGSSSTLNWEIFSFVRRYFSITI